MTDEGIGTRERIVRAAATLLDAGGRDAASTRAVAAAAGVQAPTIYRLFGDMGGLLDAVAEHGFASFLREKQARERLTDPVADLRRGWDLTVEFGLANPAIYRLMLDGMRPASESAAGREAIGILHARVSRVAEAGRLRVGVERAVRMIHAAGSGVILALIDTAPDDRDPALSSATREAILAAILTVAPDEATAPNAAEARLVTHAVALKAALAETPTTLSPAERALLAQWLDTIAATAG